MYDPRNILRQKPETVRDWILTILAMLVVLNVNGFQDISPEATAIIGLVIYKTLSLFYVEPAKKNLIENNLMELQREIDKTAAEAPAVVVEDANLVNVEPEAAAPPAKKAAARVRKAAKKRA